MVKVVTILVQLHKNKSTFSGLRSGSSFAWFVGGREKRRDKSYISALLKELDKRLMVEESYQCCYAICLPSFNLPRREII